MFEKVMTIVQVVLSAATLIFMVIAYRNLKAGDDE